MKAVPSTVAELGPGSSLGVGIAALLSGIREYVALDLVRHADAATNVAMLDGLVRLFEARAATTAGLPFPHHILTDSLLSASLSSDRIECIRSALTGETEGNLGGAVRIRYVAPWSDVRLTERASFDLIISQSVLEHVDDLAAIYAYAAHALAADGWMSHWIDFKCHRTTSQWNGHWACGDPVWSMLRGRKPFLINRQPLSVHLRMLEENRLSVTIADRVDRSDGIPRGSWHPGSAT
jgi:hypothetical protein